MSLLFIININMETGISRDSCIDSKENEITYKMTFKKYNVATLLY